MQSPPREAATRRRVMLGTLALALLGSGCAMVKPSQRAALAMPEMDPANDALEHAFYGHVEGAREGAFGGHGTQGGGCGCG